MASRATTTSSGRTDSPGWWLTPPGDRRNTSPSARRRPSRRHHARPAGEPVRDMPGPLDGPASRWIKRDRPGRRHGAPHERRRIPHPARWPARRPAAETFHRLRPDIIIRMPDVDVSRPSRARFRRARLDGDRADRGRGLRPIGRAVRPPGRAPRPPPAIPPPGHGRSPGMSRPARTSARTRLCPEIASTTPTDAPSDSSTGPCSMCASR